MLGNSEGLLIVERRPTTVRSNGGFRAPPSGVTGVDCGGVKLPARNGDACF